jgi:hypothetical protein
MSIVLVGSTSGSITLQEPAVAGTTVLDLPAVSGTILTTTSPKAGNVIQVVSTAKTDTFSASVASFGESGDVTGLSCSITPSSTSSRVLVTFAVNLGCPGNQFPAFIAYCNGSLVAVGDSSGSRRRSTAQSRELRDTDSHTVSMTFLHSPASTSAQVYTIRLWHGSGGTQTIYVNRSNTDSNDAATGRNISTITAMEIAA